MTAFPQASLVASLDSLESALASVRSQLQLSRERAVSTNLARAEAITLQGAPNLDLARKAEQIYEGRRARDEVFGGLSLFADPAWDIMLDLFLQHFKKRRISVSSSAVAACVAPTTALRWIERLVRDGLVEREPDPDDRRRHYLSLSGKGLKLMAAAVAQF